MMLSFKEKRKKTRGSFCIMIEHLLPQYVSSMIITYEFVQIFNSYGKIRTLHFTKYIKASERWAGGTNDHQVLGNKNSIELRITDKHQP